VTVHQTITRWILAKKLRRKMKYVALLIAFTGMAVAQVKLVDNSPAGSPLQFTFKGQDASMCKVRMHNDDTRPFVAVVVYFDPADPDVAPERMTVDYFLKSDELIAMYGKDIDMSFLCTGSPKTITVTTKLVQFSDGQVWEGSDTKDIAQLAADRRESIDYLNEFLTVTDIKAALATMPKDANGHLLQRRYGEQLVLKDSPDPIATAKDRLANTTAHASWLLNLN